MIWPVDHDSADAPMKIHGVRARPVSPQARQKQATAATKGIVQRLRFENHWSDRSSPVWKMSAAENAAETAAAAMSASRQCRSDPVRTLPCRRFGVRVNPILRMN